MICSSIEFWSDDIKSDIYYKGQIPMTTMETRTNENFESEPSIFYIILLYQDK